MLTFAELKQSSVVDISSLCADHAQFARRVNDATRRLMRRGDWSGTLVPIHTCVRAGCIVFPRYVGGVRKINVCNSPVPISNLWYNFLETRNRHIWGGWCGGEARMTGQERASTFSDIYGDGRFVRAYVTAQPDLGKTIRIFGVDNNNQPLRTVNGDGTYTEGIVLSFANPFASTSDYVRRIDRVIKDVTTGDVRLYAYDPAQDVLEDIALYAPTETVPEYSKYKLQAAVWPRASTTTAGSCCPTLSVIALVKLRFVPVVSDTDLVLIDNLDALKLMVQALRYEDNGDRETARGMEADAIRELNLGLRDDFPEEDTPVVSDPFSGIGIGYQKVW